MADALRNRMAVWTGVVLAALAVAVGGCGGKGVAARVNRQPVTSQDLDRRVAFFEAAYGHKLAGSEYARMRGQLLDMMIEEEVVLQEARRRRVTPKPEEVEQEYRRVRNYLKQRAYGGSEKKLRDGMKLAGISDAYLREYVTRQLTGELLFRQVTSRVTLSDAELRRIYEENKAQFKEPDRAKVWEIRVDSRAAADKVLDELRKGRSFADVAREYSMDPLAKRTGGFNGWMQPGTGMLPELEEAIFTKRTAKPHTITGPIQSHVALHIVRVEEFVPGVQRTYDEVKDQLRQQVLDNRRQKLFQDFTAELERRARIARYE